MYIIITASPNTDGLTAACGNAAVRQADRPDRSGGRQRQWNGDVPH